VQAVILAFTIDRRCYGYEIANRVEHGARSSFLPNLDRGNVYNALQRLERMGYVAAADLDTEHRITKRRRWHHATDLGREAHRHWVARSLSPEPERTEILGRIVSAARLGPVAIRKILAECDRYCDERERALDTIQRLEAACPNMDVLCDQLVLAERRIALRGLREWVKVAGDEIDNFVQQQTSRHLEHMRRPERDALLMSRDAM
jgi:DNA-binding PadR family transcriptional regulator